MNKWDNINSQESYLRNLNGNVEKESYFSILLKKCPALQDGGQAIGKDTTDKESNK